MLTPEEHGQFFRWAHQNNVPLSRDYDMSGFWKALQQMDPKATSALNPNDSQLHFPDYWKLPNHPTFSTESKYADMEKNPNIPSWQGGPIETPQAQAMNPPAESWALVTPKNEVVESENPFVKKDFP